MPARSRRLGWGFTLIEMLTTVALISIMASIAVPNYDKAVQRGRWRSAHDILLTMYVGEKVYAINNNGQYKILPRDASASDWAEIFMDNPNASFPSSPPFYVDVGAFNPPTFTAGAGFLACGSTPSGLMTIDQDGVIACDAIVQALNFDFCPP